MLCKYDKNHPKWRAKATTAFLSFHKSEIGIPFPSKSNTFTESRELVVSSLNTGDSTPVLIHQLKQLTFKSLREIHAYLFYNLHCQLIRTCYRL